MLMLKALFVLEILKSTFPNFLIIEKISLIILLLLSHRLDNI